MSLAKKGFWALILISAYSLGIIPACGSHEVKPVDVGAFINSFEVHAEFISRRLAEEQWKERVNGLSDSLGYYSELRQNLYKDAGLLKKIEKFRSLSTDELLRRKIDLIYRAFLTGTIGNQPEIAYLTDSLDAFAERYRLNNPQPQGSMATPDGRRAAYLSRYGYASDLSAGLKTLIGQRHQMATRLGYNSYYDLMLNTYGIDRELLSNYLAELAHLSDAPYYTAIDSVKQTLGIDSVNLWDIEYLVENTRNELNGYLSNANNYDLLCRTFLGWDDNIKGKGIYFDARPGNMSNNEILIVHIPDDIRILYSDQNNYTALKDLFDMGGQAIYANNVDQKDFIMSQPPSICFDLGMRRFFTDLVSLKPWLVKYAGLTDKKAQDVVNATRLGRLLELRQLLLYNEFEQEMYSDPYADADQLFAQLYRKYLNMEPPKDMPLWAAQTEYIDHPLSDLNQLMGIGIAAQTFSYLINKYGQIIDDYHTREFLVQNYFRFGASEDWHTLVKRGTGEVLKAKYYLTYCQM